MNNTLPATAEATLRPITPADAQACGRIIYEAFHEIAQRHGFAPDFPSIEAGTGLAQDFIRHPNIYGVVCEQEGRVVGSNFLDERSIIRGVGPITVDPACHGRGIGRCLMEGVLTRAQGSEGVRLVQDAFNLASCALYTSLGFDVKEPLMLMQGRPRSHPPAGYTVRPMQAIDLEACDALGASVHGFGRAVELQDALRAFTPFVAFRQGTLRAYASAVTFWPMNHGVAETDTDMQALILGAAAAVAKPLALLVPTRRHAFFRWCLSEGLRALKPMTLMAQGSYEEPRGAFYPSVIW